jgi:hypothetical protein
VRLRRGKNLHPAFAAVFLTLSNISQGQAELIRTTLQYTVRGHCAQSNDLLAPEVTVEDVHNVFHWFSRGLESERWRQQKKDMYGTQRLRKSKTVIFRGHAEEEEQGVQKVETDETETGLIPRMSKWTRAYQCDTDKRDMIPDTPPKQLFPDNVLDSAPTDSYTVFSDSFLHTSGRAVYRDDDMSGKDFEQHCKETAPNLRIKILEVELHRLLAEENKHIHLAEEQRAKSARHQQEALAIRTQIEETQAEVT